MPVSSALRCVLPSLSVNRTAASAGPLILTTICNERLTQVFTTCRAIEAAQRERMAEAAAEPSTSPSDAPDETFVPSHRLKSCVRAFPIVTLALTGAIMATHGLYSESMWLYPFNVNSNKCAPCYCKGDGRLTTCPKLVGELTTWLDFSNKGAWSCEGVIAHQSSTAHQRMPPALIPPPPQASRPSRAAPLMAWTA